MKGRGGSPLFGSSKIPHSHLATSPSVIRSFTVLSRNGFKPLSAIGLVSLRGCGCRSFETLPLPTA